MTFMESCKSCGVKLADSLYSLSVYSILAYSGVLALLAAVALAVAIGAVEVPEFHPK